MLEREREGVDLAVWTASFHYNTDNIHIHFATVEPYPTREFMMYQGQIERREDFKRKNIEVAKSKVVNELMQTREINQKIQPHHPTGYCESEGAEKPCGKSGVPGKVFGAI